MSKLRIHRFARVAFALSLALAAATRAEEPVAPVEPAQATAPEPVLEPDPEGPSPHEAALRASTPDGVETIEIIGKREEPAIFLDTPVEVEAIPEQRVRDIPAQSLADVAANLTGVRTQARVQGEGSVASVEGLPAEYTKALVNGHHYAGELGGVSDLEDMPTANASRILVLRGPQATRYGSEAAGAVIDVQTLAPPIDDGWRLLLDGGGGGDAHYYGSQVTAARVGALGATLATTYNGIDGFKERGSDSVIVGPGPNSRESWQDGYGTFEYDASEALRLRSNLGWRKDETTIRGENGLPNEETKTPRWLGSAGFDAQLGPDTEFEANVFRYESDMNTSIGRDFELRDEEWVLDTSLAHGFELLGLEPAVRVGMDWHRPKLDLHEGEADPALGGLSAGDVNQTATSTGFYAILETRLTDWANLQLGGREQLHSQFDSEFVPQAALLLEPRHDVRLRLSWGTGYRTPSLRDLYQPPVPNLGGRYYLAGNPNLETESAIGLRAGIEFDPADNLFVSATFFNNVVDDYIRSLSAGSIQTGEEPGLPALPPDDLLCRFDPNDPQCLPGPPTPILAPLFRKTNLDKVRTRGVEAQIRYRPHPLVELRGGYGYLTTQIDSPTLIGLDELPNEPRHTVDLDATITLPRVDTILFARARWRDGALVEGSGTGGFAFTTGNHSDPSWVVDLRVRQPLRSGLSVYLDVRNLTNTKAVDSYEIRGTTVFAGISLDLQSN